MSKSFIAYQPSEDMQPQLDTLITTLKNDKHYIALTNHMKAILDIAGLVDILWLRRQLLHGYITGRTYTEMNMVEDDGQVVVGCAWGTLAAGKLGVFTAPKEGAETQATMQRVRSTALVKEAYNGDIYKADINLAGDTPVEALFYQIMVGFKADTNVHASLALQLVDQYLEENRSAREQALLPKFQELSEDYASSIKDVTPLFNDLLTIPTTSFKEMAAAVDLVADALQAVGGVGRKAGSLIRFLDFDENGQPLFNYGLYDTVFAPDPKRLSSYAGDGADIEGAAEESLTIDHSYLVQYDPDNHFEGDDDDDSDPDEDEEEDDEEEEEEDEDEEEEEDEEDSEEDSEEEAIF